MRLYLITAIALANAIPALAQDAPQQATPPQLPPSQLEPRATPPTPQVQPNIGAPGGKTAKGDPGMMGLPWPKTPEEASKTLSDLFAHLATSDDKQQAGYIAASIEKLWRLPGGDTANVLMDRGHNATMKDDLTTALKFLDAAVALQPDYAEAWNRRAYTHYRLGNAAASLDDLRRVLALEPNHFRALDGMGKILAESGEKKAALAAYEQLLKVHPNIEGGKEAVNALRPEVEGQPL